MNQPNRQKQFRAALHWLSFTETRPKPELLRSQDENLLVLNGQTINASAALLMPTLPECALSPRFVRSGNPDVISDLLLCYCVLPHDGCPETSAFHSPFCRSCASKQNVFVLCLLVFLSSFEVFLSLRNNSLALMTQNIAENTCTFITNLPLLLRGKLQLSFSFILITRGRSEHSHQNLATNVARKISETPCHKNVAACVPEFMQTMQGTK